MATRRIVYYREGVTPENPHGDADRVALTLDDGNKYRHLLAMSESGLRVVNVPLDEELRPAGEYKPRKHIAAFRRFAKVFGSTAPAREALTLLDEEASQC